MNLSIVTIHYNDIPGLNFTYNSLKKLIKDKINVEWVVIDGGTNFNSCVKGKDLLGLINKESNVFISEPDNGIYDAMNKGINYSKGNYVLFMNAGDSLLDSNIMDYLNDNNDVYVFNSLEGPSADDCRLKKARKKSAIWWGMTAHHQAMVIKRELIKKFRFDTSIEIASDYKLLCKVIVNGGLYKVIDQTLCFFDTNGLSSNNFLKGLDEQQTIRREVLKINPILNKLIEFMKLTVYRIRCSIPSVYELLRYER